MAVTPNPLVPQAGRVVVQRSRTPDELRRLVNELKEYPMSWFLYSVCGNMQSAIVRCAQLRHNGPVTLVEFQANLEFKSQDHGLHGPCVLVRWVPPS